MNYASPEVRWVAPVAFVTGVLITLVSASALVNRKPELQEPLLEFKSMSPSRQAQVLATAHSLAEPDWERLSAIHTAVQEDADLRERLEKIERLHRKLDSSERIQLEEKRKSLPDEWISKTQELYHIKLMETDTITIRMSEIVESMGHHLPPDVSLPDLVFSHDDYLRFLDSVVSDHMPPEAVAAMNGLDESETMLAKTIWLMNQTTNAMRSRDPDTKPLIDLSTVYDAFAAHLAKSDFLEAANSLLQSTEQREREKVATLARRPEYKYRFEGKNAIDENLSQRIARGKVQRIKIFLTIGVMNAAVDSLREIFNKKYLPQESDQVALFESLDISQRQQFMMMPPDMAVDSLQQKAALNEGRQAVVELNKAVNEFLYLRNRFRQSMLDMEKRGRGDFGGPGRPRGERGMGESGPGPGGPGQRGPGPGGPRPGEQRHGDLRHGPPDGNGAPRGPRGDGPQDQGRPR